MDKTRQVFGPSFAALRRYKGIESVRSFYRRIQIEVVATPFTVQYDPRAGATAVPEYEQALCRALSAEEEDRDF